MVVSGMLGALGKRKWYHIIQKSDLAVFVADNGEGHCDSGNL